MLSSGVIWAAASSCSGSVRELLVIAPRFRHAVISGGGGTGMDFEPHDVLVGFRIKLSDGSVIRLV